jgi:hypothetical protein
MAVMARSLRSDPLALAVLVTPFDGPAHPYDIAPAPTARDHDRSMRLNGGSLDAVVGSLAERALVEGVETRRQGNRPARTVDAVTETGRGEALDWHRELRGEPVTEHPQFEDALTPTAALDPDGAAELLAGRPDALERRPSTSSARRQDVGSSAWGGCPCPRRRPSSSSAAPGPTSRVRCSPSCVTVPSRTSSCGAPSPPGHRCATRSDRRPPQET